ncbi:MAG: uracil-DNA glycosylase [Muribaculaceae bacterium]|nr:uracil-DNA glycosylase [Muribaculaceae bacterium]
MNVNIESGWKTALQPVFDSPDFRVLAEKVHAEYANPDFSVYPPASRIFAAFDLSPFEKTKVVIVGQDPYHGPGQANGLAFSVNPGVPIPPSLVNIFREVSTDTGAPVPTDGNLERWARQGVLLLNASLSVRAHSPRSHAAIGWYGFTDAVIRALSLQREGLVFLLWGSDAIRRGAAIDRSRHLVLTAPHPSPLSAYRGFFGCRHFSAANAYLISHGQEPIIW